MKRIGIELNGIVRDINSQIVKYYTRDIDKTFDDESVDKNVVDIFKQIKLGKTKKNEFLFTDYPYEVYGCARTMTKNLATKLNNWMISLSELEDDDYTVSFFSCNENGLSIQSTYFFLSKIGCKARKMIFPEEVREVWDNFDVVITTSEKIADEMPDGEKFCVGVIKNDNKELSESVQYTCEKLEDLFNDEFLYAIRVTNGTRPKKRNKVLKMFRKWLKKD